MTCDSTMTSVRTSARSILMLLVTWGLLLPWLPGHALPLSLPAAGDTEGQGQHEDRDYVYEDALTLMDNESPWMLLSNHSLPSPDDVSVAIMTSIANNNIDTDLIPL